MRVVGDPIGKILHAYCPSCRKCRRCWCSCPDNKLGVAMPTQNQCEPKPQRKTTNF